MKSRSLGRLIRLTVLAAALLLLFTACSSETEESDGPAGGAACPLPVGISRNGEEGDAMEAEQGYAEIGRPPIDLTVPANLATATLGMG